MLIGAHIYDLGIIDAKESRGRARGSGNARGHSLDVIVGRSWLRRGRDGEDSVETKHFLLLVVVAAWSFHYYT